RHRVYIAEVIPHWIAEKSRFWYRKAGTKGTDFILVDRERNTSGPAFDHARLAVSLSKATKRDYQPTELPFDTFDYAKDAKSVSFQVEGTPWTCQLENYECKRGPEPLAGQYEEASPKADSVIFDVQKGRRIDVKTPSLEVQFQGGPGFEWFPDNKTIYYEAEERGEKAIELRTVDSETGEQKVVVREKSDHYVDP